MDKTRAIALLVCIVLAAGCGRDAPPDAHLPQDAGAASRVANRTLGKVATKVRTKLEHQDITLKSTDMHGKAAITPQGDLVIEGRKIAIDDAQRELLLQYRAGIIDIAATGADIGMQGADFGLRAAGKALRGALSGNGGKAGEEIDAEAREFEASARRICDHLPPLLDAQQQLVAQLPEFAPYAKMEQSDIDDCLDDTEGAVEAATS